MRVPSDRLYQLLPQYVRTSDHAQGEPLRALMEVLESELRQIEEATAALYERNFIETCDLPTISYIGDLVGVPNSSFVSRALVANALGHRRRKGISTALGRVAANATGWSAQAKELFRLRVRTQSVAHPEPGQGGTVETRTAFRPSNPRRPFAIPARTVDVRRTATDSPQQRLVSPHSGATPNVGTPDVGTPDVGLELYRLDSFPISGVTPYEHEPGGFTFNPFGQDVPLFNRPRPLTSPAVPAHAENLPGPLARPPLAAEIAARRAGRRPATDYFSPPPVLEVFFGDRPVPPEALDIRDLEEWQRPDGETYRQHLADGRIVERPIQAMVDPVLGRLTVTAQGEKQGVRVSYSYGFSDAIGGGPYGRADTLAPIEPDSWWAVVDGNAITDGQTQADGVFPGLDEALLAWRKSGQTTGHVRILDNATHVLPASLLALELDGRRLVIEAADGRRPTIVGDVRVHGSAVDPTSPTPEPSAHLMLGGLWIEGQIHLRRGVDLTLADCTLRPPAATDPATPSITGASLLNRVFVRRSILGPIQLPASSLGLWLEDSIVDAGLKSTVRKRPAISGPGPDPGVEYLGPPASLVRTTVFGRVAVEKLEALNVLFVERVTVRRLQEGWVQYSYLPSGSRTPPPSDAPDVAKPLSLNAFTSAAYGAPGYAQLDLKCPLTIRNGGSEGAEIGAFHRLFQPQREAQLDAILREYVRWPLHGRYYFVT